MARYREKPIVIEADQFFNDKRFPVGVCDCAAQEFCCGTPHIHTLEGVMEVSENDWIITGVNGERYLCKPDIFEKTYDRVD